MTGTPKKVPPFKRTTNNSIKARADFELATKTPVDALEANKKAPKTEDPSETGSFQQELAELLARYNLNHIPDELFSVDEEQEKEPPSNLPDDLNRYSVVQDDVHQGISARRSSAPTLSYSSELSEVETITKVRGTAPILGHKWSGDSDIIGYHEFRERIKSEPIYDRAPTFLRIEFLAGQLDPSIWSIAESKVLLKAARRGCALPDDMKLRWMWDVLDNIYGHHRKDFQSSWEDLVLGDNEPFDTFLARLYSVGRRYAEARGTSLTDYEISHRLHRAMPEKLKELLETHIDIMDDLDQMEGYCRQWCKKWHHSHSQLFHAKVAVARDSTTGDITKPDHPNQSTSSTTSPRRSTAIEVDPRNKSILGAKCQRCMADVEHETKLCPLDRPADSANRCNWCGLYHPPRTRCPGGNPRHKHCDRCGTRGHLARACLRALSRSLGGTTASEAAKVISTCKEQNSAIILETPSSPAPDNKLRFLHYVTTSPGRSPAGRPRRRGMIDSGATAFFASTAWWSTEMADPYFKSCHCQCVASLAADLSGSEHCEGAPITEYVIRDVHLDDDTVLPSCLIYHLRGSSHDLIIPKSALSTGGNDVVWLSSNGGNDILLIGNAASHTLKCLNKAGLTEHCISGSAQDYQEDNYVGLQSGQHKFQYDRLAGSVNYIELTPCDTGINRLEEPSYTGVGGVSFNVIDSPLLSDILCDSVGDKVAVSASTTKDGELPESTYLYFELSPGDEEAPLGRLIVRAPWKEDGYLPGECEMRRAFSQAKRAHQSLSPQHQREVDKKVEDLISRGFISKARVKEDVKPDNIDLPVIDAAMPMFGVWHKGKGKVRLVVDGSYFRKFTSKASPPYDNTHMSLFYNLLSLRSHKYFVVGDFAQAYHSIGLNSEDAVKFGAVCVQQAYIWHRVGFGLNFSGAGLSQGVESLKHLHRAYGGNKGLDAIPQPWRHMWTQLCENWSWALAQGKVDPSLATDQAAMALHDLKLYVDDYHSSDDDPLVCLQKHYWSSRLAQAHGISSHLTKVFTNISLERQQEGKWSDVIPTPNGAPFLGLWWTRTEDALSPILKTDADSIMEVVTNPSSTKADLVSATSTFYDPCGLATEVSVAARRLCRSLNYMAWDGTLPQDARAALRLWTTVVTSSDLAQPRALNLRSIYTFSDSSGEVKACDIRDGDGHRITSRAKLFTADEMARWGTPRREMEAFALACEHLDKTLTCLRRMNIHPESKRLYTDSQALLYRLRRENTKDMTPHERRLVARCKGLLMVWDVSVHHVKSAANPADTPSRAYVNGKTANMIAMKAAEVMKGIMSPISKEVGVYFDPKAKEDQDEDLSGLEPYALQLNFITLSGLDASDILKRVDGDPTTGLSVEDYVDPEKVRKAQKHCPRTQLIISRLKTDPHHADLRNYSTRNDILVTDLGRCYTADDKPKYYLPYMADYLKDIIWQVHDKCGHKRSEKIKAILSRWIWSPSLYACISKVIKKCDFCLQYKGLRSFNTSSGTVKPAGLRFLPWQVCAVDLQGPMKVRLRSGEVDKFAVVTATDSITGYCRSAVVWEFSSSTVMYQLNKLFLTTDFPKICFTDKGSNLSSKFAKRKFEEWNCVHLVLPSHPESYSGFFEIVHRSINDGLRSMLSYRMVDGREEVEIAVLEAVRQFNVTPLSPTFPVSPHECMYIMSPRIHSIARVTGDMDDDLRGAEKLWPGLTTLSSNNFNKLKSYVDEQTARKLESLAQFTLEWRRRHSRAQSYLQKKWRRLREAITPGSVVYRYNPNRMKLGPKWIGPFKVVRSLSHHVILIEDDKGEKVPELLHNLKVVEIPDKSIDPAATAEDLIQLDKIDGPPVVILDDISPKNSPRRSARIRAREHH